eukprot:3575784-Amphidinium_carterae.1
MAQLAPPNYDMSNAYKLQHHDMELATGLKTNIQSALSQPSSLQPMTSTDALSKARRMVRGKSLVEVGSNYIPVKPEAPIFALGDTPLIQPLDRGRRPCYLVICPRP